MVIFIVCITILMFISKHAIDFLAENNHFVLLSKSLLEKRLDIPHPPSTLNDLALYQGKYYVPFGILPSLFLLPLSLLFGVHFSQQILAFLAAPVTFFLLYKIARSLSIKKESDALWLATFFIFGTLYIFLILVNISAYLIQILGILFIIAALYEYFHARKWLLIGIYIGLATLTRSILVFSSLFFIIEILSAHTLPLKKKVVTLLIFSLPILVNGAISSEYNYLRFHNIFDNGYNHNYTHGQDLILAREQGFFSLKHIPGNIYLLLFKGPDPLKADSLSYVLKPPYIQVNYWGLGIFFTSPLFLYLIFVNYKKKHVLSSLITITVMLIPTLTYYAYGAWQYGYRHALDFYPYLFILLLSGFENRFPLRAKVLICYSILFNIVYMFSIWGVYPSFIPQ